MEQDNMFELCIKSGTEQAFLDIYQSYGEYALRTALAITRCQSMAADAVQESFIRVYKNLKSFNVNKPFKPWFYTILVNECNRLLKARSTREFLTDSPQEFGLEDVHPFEDYEDLYRAINNLDQETRTAIILKYLNDFSDKEIASILGLNINTLKSRLFKGRQKLRKVLEDSRQEGYHGC